MLPGEIHPAAPTALARTSLHLRTSALAIALFGLGACKHSPSPKHSKDGAPEVATLAYLNAPGTVTLPELAEDLGFLGPLKLEAKGSTFSGPQDIQAVVSKNTDFGGAFTGSIVKLVASGAPVRAVVAGFGSDSTTWTGFYVLDGSPLRTARDLIGKKVAMNTLGAHTEFMIREWLRRGGLTPQEILKVVLVPVPPINCEQLLRTGQVDVAALAGAVRDRAIPKGGIHPLFKDSDLYGDFTSGAYVFRKDFIEKNPATVRTFATGIAKTLEWERTRPVDTVVQRLRSILAKRGRNETDGVVKFWRSSGISARWGLLRDKDVQVWIDFLVKQGDIAPGAVKASDVYTDEFNSFKDSLR